MADGRLHFERTMSDQEALMWALEQDPVLRSTFAQLTLLDRPGDPARFRDRMARCARQVPRLCQRVVDPLGGIGSPEWVDDPLFDLDFHVRHVSVPAPGTFRQLLDLAALLASDPFDRARPLWQFTLIDGLADGTGALLAKLHHTITDGEGGVRLSALFVDLERDPASPPADDQPEEVDAEPTAEAPAADGDGLGRNPVVAAADNLLGGVRGGLDFARRTLTGAGDAVAHPTTVPTRAADALDASRSLFRQAAVVEPARSPLWGERSLRRRLEVLSISLDEVKQAAKALGGRSTTSSSPGRWVPPAPTTGPRANRSSRCAWPCPSAPAPTGAPGATPSPPPASSCPPASRTRSSASRPSGG